MSIGTQRITRRTTLKLPLLAAAAAALPAVTGRAAEHTLRYVPYSNLIVMDPVWSISIIGLEHAFMTCDQLYGLDEVLHAAAANGRRPRTLRRQTPLALHLAR